MRSARCGWALVLVLLVSTVDGAAQSVPPTPGGRPFLDVAVDAARWIRASAVRTPDGLTWPAVPGTAGDATSTGTDLYSGAPGVVLFLIELHRATGEARYLAEARAGADALMARVPTIAEPGLYTGLAGVGFTLAEVARVTGEAKYREGARAVVAVLTQRAKPVGDGVEWNDVTDIIGGSAGTGLFLLHAATALDLPEARLLAAKAGRRLLALGRPESGGLKWAMSPTYPQLLPNFSHGTAGIAYFLATLFRDTKDRAFLDGGLAGARYLQATAQTEGDVCLIFHHEPDDVGRRLFYLGWCHGPAGTARLWYRLWQVTGDRTWLEWMTKSARGVLVSGIPERETPGFWNNVSQCCGSAGVAQFFLELHQVTGDASHLAFARRITAALVAKATRDAQGTRWIQAEHRTQPESLAAQTGWMQGAAGIGAWFLRLDAFDQRQSPRITLPDSPF